MPVRMSKDIYYSDKYEDDKYEYRHVMLPKVDKSLALTTHAKSVVPLKRCEIVKGFPLYISSNYQGVKLFLEKSRIRETLNLSTDADHRTNIFLGGGMITKKIKKNTCDM